MPDIEEEIKELKVRVYDLSSMRAQLDNEIGQTNVRIAELTKSLGDPAAENGQLPVVSDS